MTSNQPLTLLQQSAASGGNAQRPIQHGVKFCRNSFHLLNFHRSKYSVEPFLKPLENYIVQQLNSAAFPTQFWSEFLNFFSHLQNFQYYNLKRQITTNNTFVFLSIFFLSISSIKISQTAKLFKNSDQNVDNSVGKVADFSEAYFL